MDTEQIFKLLMEIGPESSNAFSYWIGLEIFKDLTTFTLLVIFFTIMYKILHPFFKAIYGSRLLRLRQILFPQLTREVTDDEMYKMITRLEIWKEKVELYDKIIEQNRIQKEEAYYLKEKERIIKETTAPT